MTFASRRRRRAGAHGQSLVEAAILFPALIIIALSGTSINSYIQAQSQINQAVSRAALVAGRDVFDPCLPGDAPGANGAAFPPNTSNGNPHGYQDVVDAFNSALSSPLFSSGNVSTLTITCTSQNAPFASVTTTTTNTGVVTTTGQSSIGGWGGWGLLQPGSWQVPCTLGSPADGGCFAVWRGGTVKISYSTTLKINWTPFWHSLTIGASAGQQIEPFRTPDCPTGPANGTAAC